MSRCPLSDDAFNNGIGMSGLYNLCSSFEIKCKQLESERDALQARVTTLQRLLDQRWEMMRELEEVCETKDVAEAVEYIKGLKTRVNQLDKLLGVSESAKTECIFGKESKP